VKKETRSNNREFGSERDVELLTGRKTRTLQKDRCYGRGFPFYRVGRKILYDLEEVRRLVRLGRVAASSVNNDAVNPHYGQPEAEQ
jgi:hypothetical protein